MNFFFEVALALPNMDLEHRDRFDCLANNHMDRIQFHNIHLDTCMMVRLAMISIGLGDDKGQETLRMHLRPKFECKLFHRLANQLDRRHNDRSPKTFCWRINVKRFIWSNILALLVC